jgi:transcriptional regulator with XRE-family HTH domain
MGEEHQEHVRERFARLLALYRRPDGSEWGGQNLENATNGTVTRSYVTNLRKGRINNPGLAKLEVIAKAMGFSPALWFGEEGNRIEDEALLGALEDQTVREILAEILQLAPRDRRLLLGIVRQLSLSDREDFSNG